MALQQARAIVVDVFRHRAHGARVGAQFDHGDDGVADHIALTGGEQMHGVAGRRAQRHHFRGGGRGIHKPQAGLGGGFSLVEHANHFALVADFLNVAQRLLFDGGEAARDIALGRLRIGKVAGFVAFDHGLITIKHFHEGFAHFRCFAAAGDDVFAAGDFGGFTKAHGHAQRVQLVEGIAHGGVGAAAGGGVGFTALGGDPQIADWAFLAA